MLWNKLHGAQALQFIQTLLDSGRVCPGGKRPDHAPKLIARVALQFKDFPAIGNRQPIENKLFKVQQRRIAPVIGVLRNQLQQVRIDNIDCLDTDDLEVKLIARAGFCTDQEACLFLALLE